MAAESEFQGFDPSLMEFMRDVAANNNREWFQDNKDRYEAEVREPMFSWIREMKPRLEEISPCFLAVARKVGGSMMRIHRDVRFAKNKAPYKTNIGVQFRHMMGKDVHAPGYYVHFSPDEFFLGVGIYRPDSASLAKIRKSIDDYQEDWLAARNDETFVSTFDLGGDSLKRPPRGYAKDHPLLDDIKRKDFIAIRNFTEDQVYADDFVDFVTHSFQAATPLMSFLCEALEVGF